MEIYLLSVYYFRIEFSQVIWEKIFKLVKRLLVDMSMTVLHHGHIRLLKKASELGSVIVGLTNDEDIVKFKGFKPYLTYEHRKEILLSISYVDKVIRSNWLIDEAFLDENNIDFLVHGDDNLNQVPTERLIIFPRTPGISSEQFRNFHQ